MSAQERAVTMVGPRTVADTREEEELTRKLILRNASDAEIRLVLGICNRYGFDPLLKHVVIVSNNIYVTRDGLLHAAHMSGQFDGIDVALAQLPDGEWSATATVWRKDMNRPIRYTAYEREHKPANVARSAWERYPRAMLAKCAEVMCLRRAFDVSLGAAEEIGYDATTGRTSQGEAQFVEAAVVETPVVLFTDAEFEATSLDLERKAADGETSKAIAAWLNEQKPRMSDQQYGLIGTLWKSILGARKAGEAWPHPDAESAPIEAQVVPARTVHVGDDWADVVGEPAATPVEVTPLGNGAARATERQVKFIIAVGQEAGYDKAGLEEQAQLLYGCAVDDLNRRDAANLIEKLQLRRNELAFEGGKPASFAG